VVQLHLAHKKKLVDLRAGSVIANLTRIRWNHTRHSYKEPTQTTVVCIWHVVFYPKFCFCGLRGEIGQKVTEMGGSLRGPPKKKQELKERRVE
jgi:hypothetical protein